MARIRSLKPEFWLDRKLARTLSRDERMLYLGLWNQADEHARAQGDPRLVKGQVFPFDDDITDDVIEAMIEALAAAGVVQQYEVDGDPYLFLPKLAKHQRLEPNKVASKHPAPPEPRADQPVRTGPDESAPRADEMGRDDDPPALLYGAGSRGHGSGPLGADETGPTFDDFYNAYPRREARRKAEQAWRAALKRAPAETILEGLRRFRFSEDRQFIPLPASWLNADRWADQLVTAAADVPNIRRDVPPWENFA